MPYTSADATRAAELKSEKNTLLANARHIIDGAKAEGREVTADEEVAVEAAMTKVKSGDTERVELGRKMLAAVMDTHGQDPEGDHWGESGGQWWSADVKAGVLAAVKSRSSFRAEVPQKAVLTSGTLLPTSGSFVQAGVSPNSQFPLASLFANQPADGPSQRYYRMGAGVAAVVPEAGLKPDAGITISPIDLLLSKLAATAQFSDEMSDDAPFLVSHLSAELGAAMVAAENAAVLAAFAATAGVLTGTSLATAVVDLIADAIASAEAFSGKTPTAVIANPTVLAVIRKSKAASAGSYMVSPTEPGPSTIHGVQLISSPATAAGVAWVVEASGVVVYRRGPASIEIGTNADDWSHNLRTMRAEERVGIAVVRPSSLTKLTLT